LLGYLINK